MSPERTTERRDRRVAEDLKAVVAAYERAIKTRSLAAVAAAYPGMTDDERASWREFFDAVSSLEASLRVEDVSVDGDMAEARLVGEYRFRNELRGRDERAPVDSRGVFLRRANGWQLRALR